MIILLNTFLDPELKLERLLIVLLLGSQLPKLGIYKYLLDFDSYLATKRRQVGDYNHIMVVNNLSIELYCNV